MPPISERDRYLQGLSERLSWLEKNHFRTREEFAEAAGVGKTTVHRWLTGDGDPQSMGLFNLARSTDVSLDWLMTGDGPRTRSTLLDETIIEKAVVLSDQVWKERPFSPQRKAKIILALSRLLSEFPEEDSVNVEALLNMVLPD
ncbi:MAG: helix-turn-helix domain-containing protein [Rhodospirillaceae bacterium]